MRLLDNGKLYKLKKARVDKIASAIFFSCSVLVSADVSVGPPTELSRRGKSLSIHFLPFVIIIIPFIGFDLMNKVGFGKNIFNSGGFVLLVGIKFFFIQDHGMRFARQFDFANR